MEYLLSLQRYISNSKENARAKFQLICSMTTQGFIRVDNSIKSSLNDNWEPVLSSALVRVAPQRAGSWCSFVVHLDRNLAPKEQQNVIGTWALSELPILLRAEPVNRSELRARMRKRECERDWKAEVEAEIEVEAKGITTHEARYKRKEGRKERNEKSRLSLQWRDSRTLSWAKLEFELKLKLKLKAFVQSRRVSGYWLTAVVVSLTCALFSSLLCVVRSLSFEKKPYQHSIVSLSLFLPRWLSFYLS